MVPTLALATCAGLSVALAHRGSTKQRRIAATLCGLIALSLIASACVLPDAAGRIAAFAAGHPLAPYAGLDRWRWAGGWAALLGWYVVTAAGVRGVLLSADGNLRSSVLVHPEFANHGRRLDACPRRDIRATRSYAVRIRRLVGRLREFASGLAEALRLAHPSAAHAGLKSEPPAPVKEPGAHPGDQNGDQHGHRPDRAAHARGILAGPAAVVALYLGYPWMRGRPVEVLSVVVYGACVAVELHAATLASLRWRIPSTVDRAAWLTGWVLTASSIASAAGAWALARPVRDWYLTRWISVPTWIVIGGIHTWALIHRSASSSR